MLLALLLLATIRNDLEKSCARGNPAACDDLGNRLQDGLGVRRDVARAAELFRKACRGKHEDGCADDARALALGEGQDAKPYAALPRLEMMCKAGRPRACGHLGDLFLRGLGGKDDTARAEPLLTGACDKRYARACANLVPVAYGRGERDRAEKFAQRACDLGDASGCAYLGDLYATSNDTVRAILNFKRACEAGSAHGCAGQGYLLLESGADPKKGRELVERGCNAGDFPACDKLRELK
jgi:TPR repeat protein